MEKKDIKIQNGMIDYENFYDKMRGQFNISSDVKSTMEDLK